MLRFHANQESDALALRRQKSIEPPMTPFAFNLDMELNRKTAMVDPSPNDRTGFWGAPVDQQGGGDFDTLQETLREPFENDRWYWSEMAKSQIFVATSGLEPHFTH
jgi:hypothetical protein